MDTHQDGQKQREKPSQDKKALWYTWAALPSKPQETPDAALEYYRTTQPSIDSHSTSLIQFRWNLYFKIDHLIPAIERCFKSDGDVYVWVYLRNTQMNRTAYLYRVRETNVS